MLRTFLRSMVLLCSSVVFTVLVVEVLLHLIPGIIPKDVRYQVETRDNKMGLAHAYIGHLHTPNASLLIATPDFQIVHHTDSHGFRNDWPWPEQADVVFVGDSLTFGYGAEDGQSWPAIFARALPNLQIVNLGLIGTGPEQQVRVYETFGKPLRPKLLVVGFFWGNDFSDAGLFDQWLKTGVGDNYMIWRDFGRLSRANSSLERTIAWIKGTLEEHSLIYNLLLHAREVYRRWRDDEPKYFRTADGSQLQLWPSQFIEHAPDSVSGGHELQLVTKAFKRLQEMTRQEGTQVLIVLQPSKEQVYGPLMGLELPEVEAPLRVALEQAKIDYIDLTPVFRQHATAGERLFYQTDGHPNAAGYQLIAQATLNYVQQRAAMYGISSSTQATSISTALKP